MEPELLSEAEKHEFQLSKILKCRQTKWQQDLLRKLREKCPTPQSWEQFRADRVDVKCDSVPQDFLLLLRQIDLYPPPKYLE